MARPVHTLRSMAYQRRDTYRLPPADAGVRPTAWQAHSTPRSRARERMAYEASIRAGAQRHGLPELRRQIVIIGVVRCHS